MPDIRSVLEDVTTRPVRPAPVDAVRAAGRRRVVRRYALTATAALGTVAATVGTVAALTLGPEQAIEPAGRGPDLRNQPPDVAAKWDLHEFRWAHPGVLLGDSIRTSNGVVVLVFAGDADPDEWRAEIDTLLDGRLPWRAEQCPGTRAHYDAIMRDVRTFRWPSGDTISGEPELDTQHCRVSVLMSRVGPLSPADVAAARDRWGRDLNVGNYVSAPPPGS